MPTISVCIPTFNYGRFLPDAIASVTAQTLGDLELIVVDNCSTDDTGGIVAGLARAEPRLRYYRNDRNLGICGNFNRALELASGEYVKILCADDWLAPQALEKSIAVLARHFGFDAVESDGNIRFVARGRAAVVSLTPDQLVAGTDAKAEPFELTRSQTTDLPQALKWAVVRSDEDYDSLGVEARRITADSARKAFGHAPDPN